MTKLNKILKIIAIVVICVILAFGLGVGIAYCVVPYETKNFLDWLFEKLNQPLPLIGISVIGLSYIVLLAFSKTSLGKLQMKKTWDLIGSVEKDLGVQKEKLEQEISALKLELESAKQECEKIKVYADEIATTIPNKKVNGLVEKYGTKEETKDID